jgi:hypothetical protein
MQAKRWTTSGTKGAEAAKKAIVYQKELLRISETFIKAQVRPYRRWRAVLFCERIWPGGLSLDGIDSRTLMDGRPTGGRQCGGRSGELYPVDQ